MDVELLEALAACLRQYFPALQIGEVKKIRDCLWVPCYRSRADDEWFNLIVDQTKIYLSWNSCPAVELSEYCLTRNETDPEEWLVTQVQAWLTQLKS